MSNNNPAGGGLLFALCPLFSNYGRDPLSGERDDALLWMGRRSGVSVMTGSAR